MSLWSAPRALTRSPQGIDAILAALFCGASLAQVVVAPIASLPVSVLVAVGSTVPLAWRRRHPVIAALAGSLIWLVPTHGFLFLGYVIAVLLYYSVGTQVAALGATVATAVTGSVTGAVATLLGPEPFGAVFGAVLAVAAPTAIGRLVAHQRAQTTRMKELAEDLRRERAGAERVAVAEERARIARELHDVIGHDVSVIALQADAAEAAIEKAPQLAKAPIAAIRESAGEALSEMRRVLGALRQDGDEHGPHPQPGVQDLTRLVDRARASGMQVDMVVSGTPRPTPSSVQLAAYRLGQEALTNARKHAPGAPVLLEVLWGKETLRLRVTDSGPGPVPQAHTGYGLIGIRERTRLLGGDLRTGQAPGGGFELMAELPLDPLAVT
ncbi:sensor histidine kinase [Sphaerimonospora mesophila]|uniref:sensor histidine kinase n=1 Tax=Sphaerimonospora mesophila TaxID=37483 RepID=UPI0009FB377C